MNLKIDELSEEELKNIYYIYFEEDCKFNLFFYLESVEYLKTLKKSSSTIYEFLKAAAIKLKGKRLICFEESSESLLLLFVKNNECLIYRVPKIEKEKFLKSNNLKFLHTYFI